MSTKRYIELYSANRNRQQWPLVSEFEVPFGAPRDIKTPQDAYDPIVSGPVYYAWTGGVTLSSGTFKTNSTDANLFLNPTTPLSFITDFYKGYNLTNTTLTQTRLILGYVPPTAGAIISTPFISLLNINNTAGNSYIITDSSDNPNKKILIPSVDYYGRYILDYSQAYDGYYIVDETMTTNIGNIISRKIVSYDYLTHTATLESPFPFGWLSTDKYTIRKTLPTEKFGLGGVITISGNIITFPSAIGQQYVGKFIYVLEDPTLTAGTLIGGSGNINQAFYVSGLVSPTQVSLSPIISGSVMPINLETVNVCGYIKDNFIPLLYNGSIVSQNETVCYEVGLLDLSLPNVVLNTGARIAYYPYVYVELTNTTSPSGASRNQIYSNNPNSWKAVFLCTVTDVVQPVNSTFVKIDAGSMVQTIKFKPNDTLHFSVYLPDGTPFQTFQADSYSPYPPDYKLQIDALFSIRRL